MDSVTYYINVSSKQNGALGIFHVHGSEALLQETLDCRLGTASGRAPVPVALAAAGLRHGWLTSPAGVTVDEVMLARPRESLRVLMTHGGETVRQAVTEYLEECGFSGAEAISGAAGTETYYLDLLSQCRTEAQAAAVLAARAAGTRVPDGVMAVCSVVLVGAPNAGKSSLLNCLAGYNRAFVHHEAGATRDVVDACVECGGLALNLADCPGFSRERDGLEASAWQLAAARMHSAEWIWFVVDGVAGWTDEAEAAAREVADILRRGRGEEGAAPEVLVVITKQDVGDRIEGEPWLRHFPAMAVRVHSLPGGNAAEALSSATLVRYSGHRYR